MRPTDTMDAKTSSRAPSERSTVKATVATESVLEAPSRRTSADDATRTTSTAYSNLGFSSTLVIIEQKPEPKPSHRAARRWARGGVATTCLNRRESTSQRNMNSSRSTLPSPEASSTANSSRRDMRTDGCMSVRVNVAEVEARSSSRWRATPAPAGPSPHCSTPPEMEAGSRSRS
eukprot:scaffold22014_cov123-Isochrysis_galbana.AAC.5